MNIHELCRKGSDIVELYACGECGKVWSPLIFAGREDVTLQAAKDSAEKCCVPFHCDMCDVQTEQFRTRCDPCNTKVQLRKAAVITYDKCCNDFVYSKDYQGDRNGYFCTILELRRSVEQNEAEMPAYVHPCISEGLVVDPDCILENLVDGHHEDALDCLVDVDEFNEFLTAWGKKQTLVSYYFDSSRVIVLDKNRFNRFMTE